jgi:hypothetical protein
MWRRAEVVLTDVSEDTYSIPARLLPAGTPPQNLPPFSIDSPCSPIHFPSFSYTAVFIRLDSSLLHMLKLIRWRISSVFYPEDGGDTFLSNVG